jgi:hypothetical protein
MKYLILMIIAAATISNMGCSTSNDCRGISVLDNRQVINRTIDAVSFMSFNTYHCFDQILLDDSILFGNMLIEHTRNGNFIKKKVLNDSEFVFSCGRNNKEVNLNLYNCDRLFNTPRLVYDDWDLMVFREGTGSDTWNDYIVSLNKDTVYLTQAYFIDTIHYRFVELVDELAGKENNVNFLVHDIRFKNTDTLKCNYYKYREGGTPSLQIFDVKLYFDDKKLQSKLTYSLKMENGSIVKDSVEFE